MVGEDVLSAAFNSIPCGLGVYLYKDGEIHPMSHNPAFYDIMGYSSDHILQLEQKTDFLGVHPEDLNPLREEIFRALKNDLTIQRTYRIFNDREGEYRWISLEASVRPQPDGTKLLYGVYSDVSNQVRLERELARANEKMQDIINAIPGGIASYQIRDRRFMLTFYSDGVMALSGHNRAEYEKITAKDALDIIYEGDRERVSEAAWAAAASGEVLDIFYRVRHKNGKLIWVHLNGRRVGPVSEVMGFYAVFTGMSEESHLYRNIANGTADGIYVIDRKNYDLLYANESKNLFLKGSDSLGRKCYEALHGRSEPCEFCTLKKYESDGTEHEIEITGVDRFFSSRSVETDWNGIPSYIQYLRDTTEEVLIRREKERLEQYFQTVVKNLPGGVAVVRYEKDGSMVPEYMSDGFAAMTDMPLEEAWRIYCGDAMGGVHPDDRESVNEQMRAYVGSGKSHCEIVYRLKKGSGGYVWVKNTLSMIQNEGGESRVYAVYRDMTEEREEQNRIRRQYKKLILQHYSAPDPNALIIGHCNITQNQILEIIDYTDSALLQTFGSVREDFFLGLSGLVVDEKERLTFLHTYLNAPSLAAYRKKNTELVQRCFIKLPREACGRYVQFKVNLVETPDSGDITGVLTVTDITDQTISDRILHQLSVTGYDFVIDLDLRKDTYTILTGNKNIPDMPATGSHSGWMAYMLGGRVVPRDRKRYAEAMNPDEIRRRLSEADSYTFSYSTADEGGDIRTKNVTVTAIDLRLGRVCVVRSDVTDVLAAEREAKDMLESALALAKEANQAKSDFLSAMSHDIRTPMNAIMGMTALAGAHLDERERVEDCLGKISVSSRHLLSLINDILDMSKIEQAKITLNSAKIYLPELTEQLSAIMLPQAKAADLQMNVRTGGVTHLNFYGDRLRINQILLNILSNAVKFTPGGGIVDFLIDELPPEAREDGVRYRFTVRDTGVGIKRELMEHIFEPFARNQNACRVEGTGLGLSITKGLVDLMDGKITVESRPGEGSTFLVELEFAAAEAGGESFGGHNRKQASGLEKREAINGRRFLVAEDNAINAEILCELLEMQGAETVVAADGAEAVRVFRTARPGAFDAVLMDIQMPELNGYEATRAIRRLPRADAGEIPIIAMTANAFAEDVEAALEAGMDAHVAKPIDLEVLWETLGSVLERTLP